jgi:hypothetical protein
VFATIRRAVAAALPLLVEVLGFGALSAAAWLKVGLWAALVVAGVALLLVANLELGAPKKGARRIVFSGPLTNAAVDLAPDAPLTNGAVDREQV